MLPLVAKSVDAAPPSSDDPAFLPPDDSADATLVVDSLRERSLPALRSGPAPGARAGDLLQENDGWIDGKFRLLEKLGEGGFGLVYKAEQIQPIQRLVAVKVLKAGMDTEQVIARFDTERQSLALMEHPNIARVLDAGQTGRGQPFFVMELVRGRSITSYCSRHELSLRQRLELFIPVCQAVNHAHQKGIIHRDLKPSNVLVMEEDGQPVPKVIDFGIAKVLEHKDGSQTLATGMDQLVGTPGYISPEQIEHGSSHVDTRSDVYALGSILLELLTGKSLVSPMDLAQKPLHQILRDQVELDPPRPSSREPSLKGDLDWIVLKALERDPKRRYGSADELANDLRRFLQHQPVHACPPSRRYLIGKFVRRHRVGVAASVAVALAVLSGGITSTALYFEAEKNRVEAMRGREELKKSYSRSDEAMARQLIERTDYTESVAWLCRALRTDPDNELAATNLLSLLEHVHLLHPNTPELPLPDGAREARLVALSRQARRVLAVSAPSAGGSARDVLSTWDLDEFKRQDELLSPGVMATCLTVTHDGRLAILADDKGRVELRSLSDGRRQPLQPELPQSVLCLTLSGDGQTLAAGSEDGTVQIWDLRQPQRPALVLKAAADKAPVSVVALDYLGTVVAAACPLDGGEVKGRVTIWDLSSGQAVGSPFEAEDGIAALALHREREMIVIGLHSGVVHVGNYRAETELLAPLSHPSAVTCLSINANGSLLTVGDGRGYLHAWDLTKGQPRTPAQPHDGEVVVAAQALERGLITSVSRHGEMRIWNPLTGERMQHRLRHSVAEVSVSPDGSMLVVAPRQEPLVQAWSVHHRMSTRRFLAAPDQAYRDTPVLPAEAPETIRAATAHGWNRAGTLVAAANGAGEVQVYDLARRQPLGPVFTHPPAVGAVTVSEDGRLAVTSGRDQEVRLWDVVSGQPTGIALRHDSFVSALALSADARHLVTVTDEGEIRVWDAASGDCLTPGIRQGAGIDEVHVSDDGRRLVFRIDQQGWFSLPMPVTGARLPGWFLDLAESLARRRLSADGKAQALDLEDQRAAIQGVPARGPETEAVARRWAGWLLADPDRRPLSPSEDESLSEYLQGLGKQGPNAQNEASRYRPNGD